MLLVCYSLLNTQIISTNNSEKKLVTRLPSLQPIKTQNFTEKVEITGPWCLLTAIKMR